MNTAQPHLNAQNPSALLKSKIIQSFWWPHSRADIACMLSVSPSRVKREWDEARHSGRLPHIERPARGFNLEGLLLARISAGRAA